MQYVFHHFQTIRCQQKCSQNRIRLENGDAIQDEHVTNWMCSWRRWRCWRARDCSEWLQPMVLVCRTHISWLISTKFTENCSLKWKHARSKIILYKHGHAGYRNTHTRLAWLIRHSKMRRTQYHHLFWCNGTKTRTLLANRCTDHVCTVVCTYSPAVVAQSFFYIYMYELNAAIVSSGTHARALTHNTQKCKVEQNGTRKKATRASHALAHNAQ